MSLNFRYSLCFILLFSYSITFSFSSENNFSKRSFLFEILDPKASGIEHEFGKLSHAGIEGGGVAVGDLNGNGFYDIFLVGDSLHGLYENKGGLKFEQRFGQSGIPSVRGATSVLIYDINKDGKPDIILGRRSVSNNPLHQMKTNTSNLEETESKLLVYLNLGDFKFCTDPDFHISMDRPVSGMTLADFDKNGLMDIAVSTWDVDFSEINSALLSVEELSMKNESPVKLFMQREKGVFEERGLEMGLNDGSAVKTSFSLTATDLDNDGWPDLIVSNDFDIPDMIYINNDGKSFKKSDIQETMSFFSMGMDAADISNNGFVDFMISDMRPLNYYRQKTVKYEKLFNWDNMLTHSDIARQEVRNTLFLNHGELQFSEIAQMINADATDWSWSVLLADFDNNSNKDIFISNGYFHQDFFKHDTPLFFDSVRQTLPAISDKDFLIKLQKRDTLTAPVFKNFFFSNTGALSFKNRSDTWQPSKALNTRGAAYADLDNDGDLDLILNNAKSPALILKNTSDELTGNNFLRVKLTDSERRPLLHSRVHIYYYAEKGIEMQMQELQPCRGFYSASEDVLHFGLGTQKIIDSVIVSWPNGKQSIVKNIAANQLLEIEYTDPQLRNSPKKELTKKAFEAVEIKGLKYLHKENNFNDLAENPLMPQMYSREGPCIAIGDLNGNGFDDVVIGGAAQATTIFYQNSPEVFESDTLAGLENEAWQEDAAILIFDYNSDGLNDLLIASGGNEKAEGDSFYRHRIYRNLGNGNFKQENILPDIRSSASVAKLNYIASDSTKPLIFIGGKIKPKNYPLPPESYLLAYENGRFVDVTDQLAPGLKNAGMISDAIWSDFDGDGNVDLIVVGEYMSPKFFKNKSGFFKDVSPKVLPGDSLNGFWNCIVSGDFNKNGSTDYVIGNLGLNTRYKASADFPLEIFAADFDENAYRDIITAYYEDGRLYPVKQLNTFKDRIAGFSKKYYKHADFASADMEEIFGKEPLDKALHLKVHTTASVYLENKGKGTFKIHQLPIAAQVAPVKAMQVLDYNKDSNPDILLAGNFFHTETERGSYTAQKGLLLEGDGNGGFTALQAPESGFYANGDCRFIEILNKQNKPLILLGRNDAALKIFRWVNSAN
ncbi:MAG: VCBS repeat-containing protein [Chitinophagales bacterium]